MLATTVDKRQDRPRSLKRQDQQKYAPKIKLIVLAMEDMFERLVAGSAAG